MRSESSSQTRLYKYFLYGVLIAFAWLALFVASGAVWSFNRPDTQTLNIIDHIYNGWVFSKIVNVLALVIGGVSVGVHALFHLSNKTKPNLMIAGFVVTHFAIVIANFSMGGFDFKTDPLPETIIDRVIDFKDRFKKNE